MKKLIIIYLSLFIPLIISSQSRNLSYYLEQAKLNSPLVNKSKNDNKIVQLNMLEIKTLLTKPQVNVEAKLLFSPIISHDNSNNTFQWISEGANSYTGYDLAYTDGGQYQAFVSVKQPLFMGSVADTYSRKADVSSQTNDNNILLTYHELERLVSHQYLLCLKAKQQSDISYFLLQKLDSQIVTMKKLVENAIYKQTDLMIMQIEAKNYRIEYQRYKAAYSIGLSDLNLLCGINDTNFISLEPISFTLHPDTITTSRFIRKYELDSLALLSNQMIFEQKYKPQLSLFADAGMNAIYLPSFNRFGFATGLSFTWNIYDGNQKKIQYDKSLVEMKTLEFEKLNFMNQYKTHKDKYFSQIKFINSRLKVVKSQLMDYEKLMGLYSLELSQAQVSIMDFKNLIRDISAKKQEYLRLQMQEQMLINSYNYWNY